MWEDDGAQELETRLARLAPDRRGAVGQDVGAADGVSPGREPEDGARRAAGRAKKLPIRYPPLKQLIVYMAPFPKNVPTAPELLARRAAATGAPTSPICGRSSIVSRRAAATRAWPEHPAFGRLSRARVGRPRLPAHGSSPAAIRRVSISDANAETRRARRAREVLLCGFRVSALTYGGNTWTTSARCCGTRWRRWRIAAARRCAARRRASPPTAPDGTPRTPVQILAHIGDLFDWALSQAKGAEAWNDSTPLEWDREVERFFAALQRFDEFLASDAPLATPPERLFQGADRRRADARRPTRDAAPAGGREDEERELLARRDRRRPRRRRSDRAAARVRLTDSSSPT